MDPWRRTWWQDGGDGVVGVVDLDVHALLLEYFLAISSIWLSISTLELKMVILVPLEFIRLTCAQHADGHQRSDDGGAGGLLPRKVFSLPILSISTVHQATLPHEV